MWTDHLTENQYEQLKQRVGERALSKRLSREAEHNILQYGGHGFQINWESMTWVFRVFQWFLERVRLFERGKSNALDYEVVEKTVSSAKVPEAFRGYRILQLSDLHIDGIWDRAAQLKELIRSLNFDLCVITGDYRFGTIGRFSIMMKRMEDLLGAIRCPDGIYGILGNHDFIEMVPGLERLGIRVLLNEVVTISRRNARIQIAGVDDEHFYEAADLEKVARESDLSLFRILLAHSQELVHKAAALQFDYYLSGHTHGGQVCLPFGLPLITNTGFQKRYIRGAWRAGNMEGYTSRGTGSSGLAVRFFCRPEITLHLLA